MHWLIGMFFGILAVFAWSVSFARDSEAEATPEEKQSPSHETNRQTEASAPQQQLGRIYLREAFKQSHSGRKIEAALLAAAAVGFDGFGRESMEEKLLAEFPVLLPPGSAWHASARELALKNEISRGPVWADTGKSLPVFSADGRTLALPVDGGILLQNLTAKGKTRRIRCGAVDNFTLSPDGKKVYLVRHGSLSVWDSDSSHVFNFDSLFSILALSPDSTLLAAATNNQRLTLWNTENLELLRTFEVEGESLASLLIREDNEVLASIQHDGKITVFQIDGTGSRILPSGLERISEARFDPSGRFLRLLGEQTTSTAGEELRDSIQVWKGINIETGKRQFLRPVPHRIGDTTLNDDGSVLCGLNQFNGSVDTLELFKAGTHQWAGHFQHPTEITLSPGGRWLVSITRNSAQIWNSDTPGDLIHGDGDYLTNTSGSLAAAIQGQFVDILRLDDGSGTIVNSFRLPFVHFDQRTATLSENGNEFSCIWDGDLYRINTKTGAVISITENAKPPSPSVLPETLQSADLVATLGGDDTLLQWGENKQYNFSYHRPLAFSKDGTHLFLESRDNLIRASIADLREEPALADYLRSGRAFINEASVQWADSIVPGQRDLPAPFDSLRSAVYTGKWNQAFHLLSHLTKSRERSEAVQLLRQSLIRDREKGFLLPSIAASRERRLKSL